MVFNRSFAFRDTRLSMIGLRRSNKITLSQLNLANIFGPSDQRPLYFSFLAELTASVGQLLVKDAAFVWANISSDTFRHFDVTLTASEDGSITYQGESPLKLIVLARDLNNERATDDFYVNWYVEDASGNRSQIVTGYNGPTRMITLLPDSKLFIKQATNATINWSGEFTTFRIFRAIYNEPEPI